MRQIRVFLLIVLSAVFCFGTASADESGLDKAVLAGDWQEVHDIVTDSVVEYDQIRNFLKHISCVTLDLDCSPFLFVASPPKWLPLESTKKWIKSLRKRHKRNATLSYLMSNIYYRSGDYQNALKELNQAVRQDDSSATMFLARSKIHILSNDFKSGLEDANKSIRLDSNLSMAYTYQGIVFSLQKKDKLAAKSFTNAIRLKPERVANYFHRANSYRELERNVEAIADYTKAITFDSTIVAAYLFRADCNFDEAALNDALADYRRFEFLCSVELKSLLPPVRARIELTEQILDKSPKDKVEILLIMGIDALEKKAYDNVISRTNKALSIDSTTSDAYYWRAFGNWYLNHDKKATEDFTRAISYHPTDTTAFFNRGNLFADSNQFDLAIQDYSSAIMLDSNYVKAYEYRAIAYEKLEHIDSAIIDYESMLNVISVLGKERREDIEDLVEFLKAPNKDYETKEIEKAVKKAYKYWQKKKWLELANEIYIDDLKSFQKVMIPVAEDLFGNSEEYFIVNDEPHRKGDFLDGSPAQSFVFHMKAFTKKKVTLSPLARVKFGGVEEIIPRGSNHAIARVRKMGFGEYGKKTIIVDNKVVRTSDGWKIRMPQMLLFLSRFLTLEPFPYGDRKQSSWSRQAQ